MTGPWHVPPDQLADYLADRVDQPTASSVEAHLVRCEECRHALAAQFDATAVDDSWRSMERAIDDELGSRVQRAASRAGVSDRTLRTLAPTLSLQVAWLAATLLALLGAAVIARRTGGPDDGLARLAFLTIAPLAPLAAVVAALSAASEPAPEIAQRHSGVTTPHRGRAGDHRHARSDHDGPDRLGGPARRVDRCGRLAAARRRAQRARRARRRGVSLRRRRSVG